MVRQLRSGGCRQPFETAFQRCWVPRVSGKLKFLLPRAKYIRRGKKKHPSWFENAGELLETSLPVRHVLEQFQRDANIHALVLPRKIGGGSQSVIDFLSCCQRSLPGQSQKRFVDVQSANEVPLFRPYRALTAGIAANVQNSILTTGPIGARQDAKNRIPHRTEVL